MEQLIAFCRRWALLISIAWLVLAVISGFLASNLRLNSDLERLLPPNAESVQNLARLDLAYGKQLDRLTILVEGKTPEENVAAVDAIAAEIAKHPSIVRVESKRPVKFFQDMRLLYMDTEDVDTISGKLTKRVKWERKRANPLFVDVGSSKAPEVDFSDIEEKYRERLGGEEYLTNDDRTGFVISAELDFASDNMDKTSAAMKTLEPMVQSALPNPGAVDISYTGRYIKRLEQRDATVRDLGRGTSLAFVLIFGFLLVYFRSLKPPVVVAVPLIAGTLCTFGTTWVIFETLNILTGFVGSVLLGLGIDYGIHLMARFRAERTTRNVDDALVVAFRSSGRASLYAGLTTVAALGSLALSSFQAFHEFGLLALIGMTFVGLAYATLFPALILLLEGTALSLKGAKEEVHDVKSWERSTLGKFRGVAVVFLIAVIPAAIFGVTKLDFEFDFHKIMPDGLPAHRADNRISEFSSVGRVPGVILVEDRAHADAVVRELERRREQEEKGEIIDRTLTVFDLLPAEQAPKLEAWAELIEQFEKLPKKVLKEQEELARFHEEVKRVVDHGPIDVASLPTDLSNRFARRDDPSKTIVLVFPSRIVHDARDAIDYSTVTSDLPTSGDETNVDAIAEEAIMRDIINDLRSDTIWMLLVTILAILFVSFMAFRDIKRILLVVATIIAGFIVAAGFVGLLHVKFNFVNIIILPIWLGLGVDAAFHMMTRVDESAKDAGGFWHTVGAVLAAFGTTMIGFGTLMISTHRGLASLGQVAVVGLGLIFLLSVAIQLLSLRRKRALS